MIYRSNFLNGLHSNPKFFIAGATSLFSAVNDITTSIVNLSKHSDWEVQGEMMLILANELQKNTSAEK